MKKYLYHVIYVISTFVLMYFVMMFYTLNFNPLQWEEDVRVGTMIFIAMLQLGHMGVYEIYKPQRN